MTKDMNAPRENNAPLANAYNEDNERLEEFVPAWWGSTFKHFGATDWSQQSWTDVCHVLDDLNSESIQWAI